MENKSDKQSGKQPKVMLLVVENRESISTEYAKMLVNFAWTRRCNIMFWQGTRRAIWWTRKRMIEQFLYDEKYNEFTHVLFLDTDVIPKNPDFLEQLIAHDKDLVSGYYCNTEGKACSYSTEAGRIGEGLEEVEYFSMGFSLIKREVLEKVSYPTPSPIEKLDADTEFCWKARLSGYKIWQDFTNKAFHLLRDAF